MKTKQDFLEAALTNLDDYPKVAMLYRAGDPRITQHLGAIAQMLALKSQEQEAAHLEGFQKERTATILADAAMRGIIPRADGVRMNLQLSNPGVAPLTLQAQRTVLDSSGYSYVLETPVTVQASGVAQVVARQGTSRSITHTIAESMPFYAIQVPQADDGSYLSSIAVSDIDGPYEWRNQYTNVGVDERVFHVEVDDRQNVYVRFGFKDVVGFQPQAGHKVTLTIGYAMGDITPEAGAPFSLEYVNNPLEAGLKIEAVSVAQRGQNPITIDTLRELARYPSTYSDNAVFLGEFDFLVRKKFPTLQFCSVWNEAHEELARGPNLMNMNALFVAVLSQDGTEQVVDPALVVIDPEANPPQPAPDTPRRIDEIDLTDTQRAIRKAIAAADDSYRIFFYTPVLSPIGMQVHARVASSYRKEDVEAQIRQVLLDAYGRTSAAARRGYNRPLYQRVYQLLKEKVPALSGGDTDWTLSITEPSGAERPELWRFVSEASLNVTVSTGNIVIPSWGG